MKETDLTQKVVNELLARNLAVFKIKHLNLVAIGNSIAAGYSFARTTKPLLLRNATLKEDMKKSDVEVSCHHFARPQNNNEEHVFDWITQNVSEIEMNAMNRMDYGGGANSMPTNGVNSSDIEEWFPLDIENPQKMRDLILSKAEQTTSIVVFAGATGSFLDNFTRGGVKKNGFGICRDVVSVEAILKTIQLSNRTEGTNTQVYITGVPNFLGLNFSFGINKKLKELADYYANVIYVEPVKSKFLYPVAGAKHNVASNEWSGFLNLFNRFNLPQMDIHYDEEEYEKLNYELILAMAHNYLINFAIIDIDRVLYNMSIKNELNENAVDQENVLQELFDKWLNLLKDNNIDIDNFTDRVINYVKFRYPHDFYYIDKSFFIQELKNKTR